MFMPLVGSNIVCRLNTAYRLSAISCLPLKPMNDELIALGDAPKYVPLEFFSGMKFGVS